MMKPAIIVGFLSLLLLTYTALAILPVEEVSTLQIEAGAFQPIVDTLRPLLIKASVLVGGIFGLYIILILVRIRYERRNMKLLQQIRYDLDQLNHHLGIPSSRERKSWFHRMFVDRLFPHHPPRHEHTVFPGRKGKASKLLK